MPKRFRSSHTSDSGKRFRINTTSNAGRTEMKKHSRHPISGATKPPMSEASTIPKRAPRRIRGGLCIARFPMARDAYLEPYVLPAGRREQRGADLRPPVAVARRVRLCRGDASHRARRRLPPDSRRLVRAVSVETSGPGCRMTR